MRELIEQIFLAAFANPTLDELHDGAVIEVGGNRIAFTTDSYVVQPLFFPGGDIGALAVNGTVNDLAMCGARPRWLSAGFIIEEGLPMRTLNLVVESMRAAAAESGVQLVTGDTKVVDKGKGDGLFVNTAGIGVLDHPHRIGPREIVPGDAVLVSGDMGRHGMAIMSVREGLQFESEIRSDCAPLADMVLAMLDDGVRVHCLRDLTRGGLTAALNEIATSAGLAIDIDESSVPVVEAVRGACEILGLDPLSVANEGRMVAIVDGDDVNRAIALLSKNPHGRGACQVGRVTSDSPGLVTMKSSIGVRRVLDMLAGDQLPRIC